MHLFTINQTVNSKYTIKNYKLNNYLHQKEGVPCSTKSTTVFSENCNCCIFICVYIHCCFLKNTYRCLRYQEEWWCTLCTVHFPPRAVELWTWLMPPSDNGHHRMNKPPHLDAFVQTIGDVSLSRRVQIFYHKNPKIQFQAVKYGLLVLGEMDVFCRKLWSLEYSWFP